MSTFKELMEYLQAPEELSGKRAKSRKARVMHLIRKRKNPNTSKQEIEKINRILGRMTGKRFEREMSTPAAERYFDELRAKENKE